MARTADVAQEDWLDLESIFLGRTIHVHSLSPLHLPSSSSDGSRLTSSDLDDFAEQLQHHLSARFNDSLLSLAGSSGSGDVLKGRDGNGSTNTVRNVRASFLTQAPQLFRKRTPVPFVVEIQINQPYPTASNPDARRLETAHLVFLSTSTRQTETHYPLLLWKASLTGRSAAALATEGLNADFIDGATAALQMTTLNARLLTSHTLSFVTAYFDCRLSILAPLHGIRGANLEAIAQSVISHDASSRKATTNLPFLSNNPMEVTFALPDHHQEQPNEEPIPGPASNLSTLSLTIPWAVLDELLQRESPASSDLPIFDILRQYLATHTSIQLSKMCLTRVGVGSVFLGAPTSTVSATGKASGGEVRLKIQRDREGESQVNLIIMVLTQLLKIAQEEEW